jgi:hypothetical protein
MKVYKVTALVIAAPRRRKDGSKKLLKLLPERCRWTLHNVIGHPMLELLNQLGLNQLGAKFHNWTDPTEDKGGGDHDDE